MTRRLPPHTALDLARAYYDVTAWEREPEPADPAVLEPAEAREPGTFDAASAARVGFVMRGGLVARGPRADDAAERARWALESLEATFPSEPRSLG